ncbi:MAG: hypothetical protein FWE82_05825 [Defluviitaleaceae bacterium]|nr:hypothetical protein [Defluviitaleaceae bacterium]
MLKLEKLHIYICIVAALVATVVCIVYGFNLYEMSLRVSLVIVIFYIIGQAVRLFITYKVFPPATNEAAETEPAQDFDAPAEDDDGEPDADDEDESR